jgi:hypothetical protein
MRELLGRLESAYWRDLWLSLNLSVHTFQDLGLPRDVSDAVVWHTCQQQEVVLVTGNRNRDGPDSLEATIQKENTPHTACRFSLWPTRNGF